MSFPLEVVVAIVLVLALVATAAAVKRRGKAKVTAALGGKKPAGHTVTPAHESRVPERTSPP